ncbi:MAG TPA: response regulator, partial [Cellvibrio sp.]|nr:response regulator [Cellvibrio sp.]
NEVNQMILFRHITKANENAEVSLASNGEAALDLVRKQRFDLILMDMEMPVMDGLTATKRIRALGDDTPLYIVSGNVSREDRELSQQAGATGHIAKPLDREQIRSLVQNLSIGSAS